MKPIKKRVLAKAKDRKKFDDMPLQVLLKAAFAAYAKRRPSLLYVEQAHLGRKLHEFEMSSSNTSERAKLKREWRSQRGGARCSISLAAHIEEAQ